MVSGSEINIETSKNEKKEINIPKIELNFIEAQTLSRNGMIIEIKTEFDIIRFCLQNKDSNLSSEMLDRIIIMPIRKLLCEKESVLLKVCPKFKMFPLDGQDMNFEDGFHMISSPLGFKKRAEWLTMDEWRNQKIAYFDRTVADFSGWMTKYVYDAVCNSLKGEDRRKFESLVQKNDVNNNGNIYEGYVVVNETFKDQVYSFMENAGYNTLTLYNFIKHISDKRGAHIDTIYSIFISGLNESGNNRMTIVECIALQMILAAEVQIPELNDYWPDSLKIIKIER